MLKQVSIKTKVEKHNKLRNSHEYKSEITYLTNITESFLYGIRSISVMASRSKKLLSNSLVLSNIDELIESSIIIFSIIIQGAGFNTAKRECRYLLEAYVKYLAVDQKLTHRLIKDKIIHLKNKIPRSSIEIVEQLKFEGLDKKRNNEITNEIKSLFSKFSKYIHPSDEQLKMHLSNFKNGDYIGFESIKQIIKINKLLFQTYDILLIICFQGLGTEMSGDLFINLFDENEKWKFNKGKYVNQFSKIFDYKKERENGKLKK